MGEHSCVHANAVTAVTQALKTTSRAGNLLQANARRAWQKVEEQGSSCVGGVEVRTEDLGC